MPFDSQTGGMGATKRTARRSWVALATTVVALAVALTGVSRWRHAGGAASPSSSPSPFGANGSGPGQATVTRIVDGDTIVVRVGSARSGDHHDHDGSDGHDEKVRLIGIDTPESVKPNTPVQCFARE